MGRNEYEKLAVFEVEQGRSVETERQISEDLEDEKLSEKIWEEKKMMWEIAGPAILTAIAQFSIATITIAFAGHLGEVELAAVSVVQNVLEGFVFGVMLGIGSALETLCGQAVGAGQFNMLGIYMQRSIIICLITSLFLAPLYLFTSPLLLLLRQSKNISELSGKYARWVVPQLFAYAINFPIQKFLLAQSKVWVMTVISIVALGFHGFFNWVLVMKLNWGMFGAAMAGNITWWILVWGQLVYVVSGYFPEAWTGFSMAAFKSLWGFVKLSLASAIMLCLDLWYSTVVILMVGWLKDPEIAVDSISICMDLQLWTMMISLGFNASVSVRVGNELGASRPKAAKFAISVAVVTSTFFGIFFMIVILGSRSYFPRIYTSKNEVIKEASKLGYFLAASILLNSIQPVLHGVAVGAGWQTLVAMINTLCYYVFGLPFGALLGYEFEFGVKGIWLGMLAGTLLQTIILSIIVNRADWTKEVSQAEERICTYGETPLPLSDREAAVAIVGGNWIHDNIEK